MRRPVLLALTFGLATLTSGVLVYAASAVTTELPAAERQRHATTNQDAVRAFYAAVNEVLRSGDPARLGNLIAPDAVLRPTAAGQTWTQDEFGGFLMALRDAYPDLQVTEMELLVQGDRVVARVSARAAARGTAAEFQRSGPPLSWEAVDVFHLTGGRVVDYSNHWPEMETPQPVWEISLDEMPSPAIIAMLRFTYPPDTAVPSLLAPGPTLLAVEAGRLAVTVYGAAHLIQQSEDAPTSRSALAAGSTALLSPGDLLVVPAGVTRAIRNDEPTPAVALEVAAFPYDPLAYVHDLKSSIISRVLTMYAAKGEFTSSVMWPPGVTVQALFEPEVVVAPSSSVTLTSGRVALATEESIAVHGPGGDTFIYVEAGSLDLAAVSEAVKITRAAGVLDPSYPETIASDATGQRTVTWATTGDAVFTANSAVPETAVADTTRPGAGPWLLAGDAVFIADGVVPAIQSMDGGPLALVVLRISPSDRQALPPASVGLMLWRAI